MKNFHNKKTLHISLVLLISFIIIGVGYASISNINLLVSGNGNISPNQTNFKVKFLSEDNVTPVIEGAPDNTVSVDSDTSASLNVTTLNRAGQSVTATYRVKNESNGIGASIDLNLTNSNPEYFKVTEYIADNELQAGDETTVTVTVEMLKTPVESEVSTTITATLEATAIENENAVGNSPANEYDRVQYVYTINNTDDIYVNTDFTDSIRTYSNFAEAKTAFGHPAAIAHILENNKVQESYVAFEKNNKVYYLKGRINESSKEDKPVYNENVKTLKKAFGENWSEYCQYYTSDFYCSAVGLGARADANGNVIAGGSDWSCSVNNTGNAHCISW